MQVARAPGQLVGQVQPRDVGADDRVGRLRLGRRRAGGRPIQQSGAALRQACAEARAIYLDVAAAKLAVAPDDLDVDDGEITGPEGASTSYWELADDALLDRAATGAATPKPESAYAVVGTAVT
ncbi:molybdopterin-dependent oxidoreductase, partial [Mycobacterium sp. 1245805.9]|uniref:molybdopterin-dependent oxidoreductase n=1 Tax=Mycobacterium sp. 1245805.9 TaxID=1856862 RepID=UPI0018D38BFA